MRPARRSWSPRTLRKWLSAHIVFRRGLVASLACRTAGEWPEARGRRHLIEAAFLRLRGEGRRMKRAVAVPEIARTFPATRIMQRSACWCVTPLVSRYYLESVTWLAHSAEAPKASGGIRRRRRPSRKPSGTQPGIELLHASQMATPGLSMVREGELDGLDLVRSRPREAAGPGIYRLRARASTCRLKARSCGPRRRVARSPAGQPVSGDVPGLVVERVSLGENVSASIHLPRAGDHLCVCVPVHLHADERVVPAGTPAPGTLERLLASPTDTREGRGADAPALRDACRCLTCVLYATLCSCT